MRLCELLADVPFAKVTGNDAVEIAGIAIDSRLVKPGEVFVALVGSDSDGHRYIGEALERGAVAVVAQGEVAAKPPVLVSVPSSRAALARMASAWYGNPGRKLTVLGITGTDGKTTSGTLAHAIFQAAGKRAGLLTTVAVFFGDERLEPGLHTTTPDPLDFHAYLARMVEAHMEYAILETTSHGLEQHRTLGAEYDVAAVTNITREHLDYHGTFEAYREAKGSLFRDLAGNRRKPGVTKTAVLNRDDSSYDYLRQFAADWVISYGIGGEATLVGEAVEEHIGGVSMNMRYAGQTWQVSGNLPGRYNAYNMMCAAGLALSQGLQPAQIAEGIASVKGIIGRLEAIDEGQDFQAYVDFAHTSNSLRNMLLQVRKMTPGKVIVTFGCAGLRDREKRPVMGQIAAELADRVVITSEDPRTEDMGAIMAEVARGAELGGGIEGETYWCIADRATAIEFAVALAEVGDLVVTTGKGHEQSMCIGSIEYPWSDHEALRQALRARVRGDRRPH